MDTLSQKVDRLKEAKANLDRARAKDRSAADELDKAMVRAKSPTTLLIVAIDMQARWQVINERRAVSREAYACIMLFKSLEGLAESIAEMSIGMMRSGVFS